MPADRPAAEAQTPRRQQRVNVRCVECGWSEQLLLSVPAEPFTLTHDCAALRASQGGQDA
ncbi:hypothetical protein BH24ACT15_BH24ACT15_34950 [soil metagenome]